VLGNAGSRFTGVTGERVLRGTGRAVVPSATTTGMSLCAGLTAGGANDHEHAADDKDAWDQNEGVHEPTSTLTPLVDIHTLEPPRDHDWPETASEHDEGAPHRDEPESHRDLLAGTHFRASVNGPHQRLLTSQNGSIGIVR
jgi:hypothetical protein